MILIWKRLLVLPLDIVRPLMSAEAPRNDRPGVTAGKLSRAVLWGTRGEKVNLFPFARPVLKEVEANTLPGVFMGASEKERVAPTPVLEGF